MTGTLNIGADQNRGKVVQRRLSGELIQSNITETEEGQLGLVDLLAIPTDIAEFCLEVSLYPPNVLFRP